MAKPFLADLERMVDKIQLHVKDLERAECKHFFTGAALYLDGQIFMSLSPVGLAIKLSTSDIEILFNQGAEPLRFFPKSPVKKDYAVLPKHIVDNEKELVNWIEKAVAFAQSKAKGEA